MKFPFFDINNLTKQQANQIEGLMRQPNDFGPARSQIVYEAGKFQDWVQEKIIAMQLRFQQKYGGDTPFIEINYDPKSEPERFLRDGWNSQADFWALVEDIRTYGMTMLSLIELLELPSSRHLMLASLGSGPGLYETYLAKLFGNIGVGGRITCVDFAEKMIDVQKFVLSLEKPSLSNIEPLIGDMTDIPLPTASQNAVICNNCLQWCVNWKNAIAEMKRILDPDRDSWVYLIVHLHRQPMHMVTSTGTRPIDIKPIFVEPIMDELEKNMFTIMISRQIHGAKNTGQARNGVARCLIKAKLTPKGLEHSWRKTKPTVSNPLFIKNVAVS